MALFFSACDKEVSDQIVDEYLMGKKAFFWVDDDHAKEYLYAYALIPATVFSYYGGKLFNNECEETAYKGITICRNTKNNGNEKVAISFGPEALDADEKHAISEYNLAVRYKGFTNTVWNFNVKACVKYCTKFGPISLDAGENMGIVTQVRYDGKGAYNLKGVKIRALR